MNESKEHWNEKAWGQWYNEHWKDESYILTQAESQILDKALRSSTKLVAKGRQIGGDHYKNFVIQPFEYCYKNNLNNLQSEAISYISRYRYKWENDKEKQVVDLQKAIHTLELLIEEITSSTTAST